MIEDKEDIKAAIIYFEKEMKKLIHNSNYDEIGRASCRERV